MQVFIQFYNCVIVAVEASIIGVLDKPFDITSLRSIFLHGQVVFSTQNQEVGKADVIAIKDNLTMCSCQDIFGAYDNFRWIRRLPDV